jgi:hypothetical protein
MEDKMLKKLLILAALLFQVVTVSSSTAVADDPEPMCFPCAM